MINITLEGRSFHMDGSDFKFRDVCFLLERVIASTTHVLMQNGAARDDLVREIVLAVARGLSSRKIGDLRAEVIGLFDQEASEK